MEILKKVCPICILVSATWLTLLILKGFDYQVNELLLAMLMGGSVVGVSYVLSRKIKRSEIWWKLLSIPVGFVLMFALLEFNWVGVAIWLAVYFLFWLFFHQGYGKQSAKSDSSSEIDIKDKLKKCC